MPLNSLVKWFHLILFSEGGMHCQFLPWRLANWAGVLSLLQQHNSFKFAVTRRHSSLALAPTVALSVHLHTSKLINTCHHLVQKIPENMSDLIIFYWFDIHTILGKYIRGLEIHSYHSSNLENYIQNVQAGAEMFPKSPFGSTCSQILSS